MMAHNDIDDILDHLRRIKNGGDLNGVQIDHIETLEVGLKLFRTFINYHDVILPDSLVIITTKAQFVVKMLPLIFGDNRDECEINLNVQRLVSELLKFGECNTSSRYNVGLNDSYLLEYMDDLDKNLNDALRYLVRSDPFSVEKLKILQKRNGFFKQMKIVRKKMRFLRYLYSNEINGIIDHEKLEGLKTLIQFMADFVGLFCLSLLGKDKDDADSSEDGDGTDSYEDGDDTDSYEDADDTDSYEDRDDADSYEDEDGSDSYKDGFDACSHEVQDDKDSSEDEDDATHEDGDDTNSYEDENDAAHEDGDDTDSCEDGSDAYSLEVQDDTDSYEDDDNTDVREVRYDTGSHKDGCDVYSLEVQDNTDAHEVRDDAGAHAVKDDTNSLEDGDETYLCEDEDDVNSHEVRDDADAHEVKDDTNSYEDGDETDLDECEDYSDSDQNGDHTTDIRSGPPHLLSLIVLVELEMQKFFLGELKASKFSRSRTFRNKKLPKDFSNHLHSLLVYLRKLEDFPKNVSARNIDVAIEFLLVFLADVPNHVLNGKSLNEVLEEVGALVGDILCIVRKLLPSSTIKDATTEINGSTEILEKIENLKAQMEERYYKSLKFNPSQFPTVGGLSFLDSLTGKLNGMLKSESSLDFMMMPHICILEKELSSLTSVFRDMAEVPHEDEILTDLWKSTVSLAYEAEIAIDSIHVHYNSLWHLFCSLPTIIKEIKHISMEATRIRFENFALELSSVVEPYKQLPAQYSRPMNDEEIVGFENDKQHMIQHLIRWKDELDVLSIVGMAGIGKTTFARMLYTDQMIVSHFSIRVWVAISQTYNRKELLQEIFSQATCSKDKVDKVEELADMLRKVLMGKRYLIVLDDMWEMAWDELRLSFPDTENGSRVVVTTRLEKVGEKVKYRTDPYSLPLLTPEEGCKLLQNKVFQQECCPPELYDVSQALAERCGGLPLVIVLIAGIIKKKKMEASWWIEVRNSLLFYLGESEEYHFSTVQLSYDNLPDHLRPCLLYMGMFPEDDRVHVSKLLSLWIVEGFVQNMNGSGRLEEAAEGYLMDLIGSNLVMVSKRKYDGKVKYCQIHDVVLHFCLEMSRKEKFLLVVKGNDLHSGPLGWKENRFCYHFTKTYTSRTLKPFHQHLRSVITYGRIWPLSEYSFLEIISELRLVKVLDLSSSALVFLSSATLQPLIHLKYLSVHTGEFDFQPKHLCHLEILIVTGCLIVSLPTAFWKMEKLRHVDIAGEAQFGFRYLSKGNKQWIFEESSTLEYLITLRLVVFSPNVDGDVLLWRCPNLQELGILFQENCATNPKLESLTKLQSLHLIFCSSVAVFHLPSNLKKLKLEGSFQIPKRVVSMIGEVPSLEYLELKFTKFEQGKWILADIKFHKLKFLKMVFLNISRWDASEATFPVLETLVVRECKKLREIPLSFADIPTLEQIKLIQCKKKSLETSAVRIKEEAEAIEGCDRINIIIDNREDDYVWKL